VKLVRRIPYLITYHLYAKRKMSRHDEVELLGFTLRVAPTVFHPKLFFTSQFLGEYVLSLNLRNKTVLDMGTGSGIIGLCSARAGADVLAVDINPTAAACAAANVARNGFAQRVRCMQSDLFSAIPAHERFDTIIWNPPFYRASPQNDAERAWNAGAEFEVLRAFAADAKLHLTTTGGILLVLSTDMNVERVLSFFSSEGFHHAAVSRRRILFETLTIFHLTNASS
jgi:release factor glutamine methyltransferase